PQRIKDTPAVLFYRIPCICIVYFKRLTEGGFAPLFSKALVVGASALSHHQKCTSMYTFDGEFRLYRNIAAG
ncbi:MAG: hypothetical protein ACTTI6_09985, partial [Treponema sp.]|uniref:hypothetical protein n=1 Tax=Treponema sp. TaxID=166 RepID=UPI003FA21DA9